MLISAAVFLFMSLGTWLVWEIESLHHTSSLVLAEGILTATVVAGAIFWVAHHRRRETQQTIEHLRAIEQLTEAMAALSARLASGPDLLNQLSSVAHQLLHTDECAILLYDRDRDEVEVVGHHTTGTMTNGMRMPLSQTPVCTDVLRRHQSVIIENIDAASRPVNSAMVKTTRSRAIMALPLLVEGGSVGVLVFGSVRLRRFSEQEQRLGELIAAHVAVTLVNTQLHQRMTEAIGVRDRLLEQRDRLAEITAEVYEARSLQEALDRIVAMIPPVLGVDSCSIQLPTPDGKEFYIAAAPVKHNAWSGRRFPMDGFLPGEVIKSGKVVVLNDAESDPRIRPYSTPEARIATVVFLPLLHSDGRAIGCLNLTNHTIRPLSADQLTMAKVFCVCAAAAISMARLHERTADDAETKAMLLRELNHRVKNNLAGIIGLLDHRPPDLSEESRQWLDRLTGRITLMSRAHELFLGGPQRVCLGDLVDQLLPALAVIKPAEVRFERDLDSTVFSLSTEKGVALAMVLYELCCNAIVHGLNGEGTVQIRSRSAAGRLTVDVIDNGIGCGRIAGADNGQHTMQWCLGRAGAAGLQGWGLRLVDGLVRRELRGRFHMTEPPDGGTVASVSFPISSEENLC